jgi:hypothetical protein
VSVSVTPKLHFQLAPFHALAMVVSPRLGSWHKWCSNDAINSKKTQCEEYNSNDAINWNLGNTRKHLKTQKWCIGNHYKKQRIVMKECCI